MTVEKITRWAGTVWESWEDGNPGEQAKHR